MRKENLYRYLVRQYRGVRSRKSASPKVAMDLCARCMKVEREFGVDLDKELNGSDKSTHRLIEAMRRKFDSASSVENSKRFALYDMVTAVNRYGDFLTYEKRARRT